MGYGFVQYHTAEAAQKALRQLQVPAAFPQLCCYKPSTASIIGNVSSFSVTPPSAYYCGWPPAGTEDLRESHKVRLYVNSLCWTSDSQYMNSEHERELKVRSV